MLVPIRTQGSTQATRETSHSPNWRRTTSSDLRPRPPLSSELRFGTNSAATLVPTTMSLCARLLRSYKFREPRAAAAIVVRRLGPVGRAGYQEGRAPARARTRLA
jgi:hypothetical protein